MEDEGCASNFQKLYFDEVSLLLIFLYT